MVMVVLGGGPRRKKKILWDEISATPLAIPVVHADRYLNAWRKRYRR
jgi:hypothetical protein